MLQWLAKLLINKVTIMKIKITFDPDGAYGYPKDGIIDAQELVNDYIEHLNEVEDADTISFLKRIEIEKAVDFVAEMWDLSYDIIPDDKVIRKCCICGKEITSGYVFDGTDCFCSKECAVEGFDNDEGCVEILIDDGERLVWMDSLPTPPHYKVNIGCASTENFHYCDSWEKVCHWLSDRLKTKIETQEHINAYNRKHKRAKIEILVFKPTDYYKYRRPYVTLLHFCDTIMSKAQLTRKDRRMKKLLRSFAINYDDANWMKDASPEIWQGEI